MKNIQLTGIGSALVDFQFKVKDSELENMNLNKSEMTLADSDTQTKLLSTFESDKANKCSGGSAANTIIAFSQMGGKAGYITRLGDDMLGNFYASEFTDLRIKLSAKRDENNPTGTCLVFITPDSERTMQTCLAASANFSPEEVDKSLIEDSEWIYIEGYALTQENSYNAVLKAIKHAKANDTKVAITFSDVFITDIFYKQLTECVKQADLIFCNENEALNFTKTETIEDAIKSLSGTIKSFVITLGSNGAVAYIKGNEYKIPSYPANLQDTTGAGDMFAAGFLYGLIVKKDITFAGHLASATAAEIVSQLGARYNDNLRDIVKRLMD